MIRFICQVQMRKQLGYQRSVYMSNGLVAPEAMVWWYKHLEEWVIMWFYPRELYMFDADHIPRQGSGML